MKQKPVDHDHQALAASILDATFELGGDGDITGTSEALLRLLGYQSRGEIAHITDLIVEPLESEQILNWLRASSGFCALQFQTRIFSEKVGQIQVELMASALNNTGPVRAYCAVKVLAQNKTQKTRVNLLASAKRIIDMWENAPCGQHSLDATGHILEINQTELAWMGRKRQEVLGRSATDFYTPQSAERFKHIFHQFLKEGHVEGMEYELVAKDGSIRHVSVSASAVRDSDGVYKGSRSVMYDIGGRKQAEAELLQLNRALESTKMQLRELAASNEAAREKEKKHIAREVHDELGQVLTALRMDTSLIAIRFGKLDSALNSKVIDMRALVDKAIQGVRNVAGNLRPLALDMGLYLALDWLRQDFEKRTSVACILYASNNNVVLDEARSIVVFRIVQESLTNICRHAQARRVRIALDETESDLHVEIQDDGLGFDVVGAEAKRAFGLLGMRERTIALGGRLDVVSAPGHGTTICLFIPLERRSLNAAVR